MSDKIIIGCDTCNGEEELFCEWLIEHEYDAEVSDSTGQGIGSEEQNRLWDQYCGKAKTSLDEAMMGMYQDTYFDDLAGHSTIRG